MWSELTPPKFIFFLNYIMNECIKLSDTIDKYAFRNSPPYSANKCKSMKKKGNDGKFYISQKDKNGIYKWKAINNKTKKNKTTKEDLQLSLIHI